MTIARSLPKLDAPRLTAAGSWAVYLAIVAVATPGTWGPWAVGALGVLLGGAAVAVLARDPLRTEGVVALWPPLHLALLLTGSLDSFLVPLAAAWVVLAGRREPRPALALAAALAAGLLVPGVQWLHGPEVAPGSLGRYLLLAALGGGLALLAPAGAASSSRAARPRKAKKGEEAERARAPKPEAQAGDDEALTRALELARRATDAHEASLWRRDADGRTATRLGWAAAPGAPEPPEVVELEGHPFAWAILEQVHVHVRRGKRDLPTPWATEMLLVPVDVPEGVLSLAYPGVTPPGAEPVALEAGQGLGTLLSLLELRRGARRTQAGIDALYEAVRVLPGELEMEKFAAKLAEAVRAGTGAAGVAVVLGPGDAGPGRVVHVATDEGREPRLPPSVGDGDSRVSLAMKHGVELSYPDLRREREKTPLFGPREQWEALPRSAAFLPLAAEGRTLGAVVAWDPEPGRFGERELDLLRRICSVAPLPMRSATRYEAVERRASTDSLTGLANRVTFETRFAAQAVYFERYARPFSVVMLDVDFFKKFNDTWGHEAGDKVLKQVAEVMRNTVREVDLPARHGGEEFVVLLPETNLRAAAEAAERLRRAIEAKAVIWNGRPLSVTVSLGVASCPDCVGAPGEMLAAADAALYRSKAGGRNRVSMAPRAGTPAAEGMPGMPPGR